MILQTRLLCMSSFTPARRPPARQILIGTGTEPRLLNELLLFNIEMFMAYIGHQARRDCLDC